MIRVSAPCGPKYPNALPSSSSGRLRGLLLKASHSSTQRDTCLRARPNLTFRIEAPLNVVFACGRADAYAEGEERK